jgi:hypothetical protein
MKGRDLIIYILENHLEDEDVLSDLKKLGLYSVGEVAALNNVGEATIKAWCGFGRYNYTTIDGRMYIWLPEGGK